MGIHYTCMDINFYNHYVTQIRLHFKQLLIQLQDNLSTAGNAFYTKNMFELVSKNGLNTSFPNVEVTLRMYDTDDNKRIWRKKFF